MTTEINDELISRALKIVRGNPRIFVGPGPKGLTEIEVDDDRTSLMRLTRTELMIYLAGYLAGKQHPRENA